MPDKRTTEKARGDLKQGKSPSTAAGEFVHREIDKIREGEHGAKNAKQAIAIGLSEARRAGVPIGGKPNRSSRSKRGSGRSASKRTSSKRASPKRARAALKALKRQPRRAASHLALSRQAHRVARSRTAASRSAAAKKGRAHAPRAPGEAQTGGKSPGFPI